MTPMEREVKITYNVENFTEPYDRIEHFVIIFGASITLYIKIYIKTNQVQSYTPKPD
jgi:hypothetical protein